MLVIVESTLAEPRNAAIHCVIEHFKADRSDSEGHNLPFLRRRINRRQCQMDVHTYASSSVRAK